MPAHDDQASPPPRAVTDPKWEVALRAGQAAEGEQGSLEDELAVVHLLRHARAPQALDDAALDRLWSDLDAQLGPTAAASGWRAWLRRPWLVLGTAGLATAAAAVLVLVWSSGPSEQPGSTPDTMAQADGADPIGPAEPGAMAATIEAQFAMLEPGARAAVQRSVDAGRSDLRGELLSAAIRADGRTPGGAP
jgi:hypothetical protein